MLKNLITITLYFIIFSPLELYGRQEHILQGRYLTVVYDDSLLSSAEKIADHYPAIKDELERTLKWEVDFEPVVILIRDDEVFQSMARHPLVVAYAVPQKDLIVINYSKMRIDPFSIDSILKHELCHLLLHKKIKSENLPRWLDEGVAQWVSGGLADIIMYDHRILDRAILAGRLIPLQLIENQFPEENSMLILAYAQSRSIVMHIVREFGFGGLLDLLRNLERGYDIDSAVHKSFSITFDELENNWYNSLKRRATIYMFIINNIYSILFFSASIILIYGFIRAFLKKRAYMKEMDEDNNGED